jgi:hypothetical protein
MAQRVPVVTVGVAKRRPHSHGILLVTSTFPPVSSLIQTTAIGWFRSSKDVSANAFIVRSADTTIAASRPRGGGSISLKPGVLRLRGAPPDHPVRTRFRG